MLTLRPTAELLILAIWRPSSADAKAGRRYRLAHRAVADSFWRAVATTVWVAERQRTLVVAVNEPTAEVKYFESNATKTSLAKLLAVALRRWTVERSFRLAKQEAGLLHLEGRDYTALIRHLTLALVVLGFVATHTERLRGKTSQDHGRAGAPGAQPSLRRDLSTPSGSTGAEAHERGHLLLPAAQRTGDAFTQEATA